MPRPIAALLSVLTLTAAAVAQRPALHECVERLVDTGEPWVLKRVTEPREDEPGDAELWVAHATRSVRLFVIGTREAVRSVYLEVGPIDPDTAGGRAELAFGTEALAAVTGKPARLFRDFLLENRDAIRSGKHAEPRRDPASPLSGNGSLSDEGLTIDVDCYFPEPEEPPAPVRGLAGIEATTKRAANWDPEAVRTYKHSTGVRVSFEEDAAGPRMVVEYSPSERDQASMSAAVWLLIGAITGVDRDTRANNQRIAAWMGEPTLSLDLIGARCRIRDGEEGRVMITVRESE